MDIETSGKGVRDNRITEICIVRLNGEKIIDKFTSLVNPQRRIPGFITGLTGIDDDMVRKAPLFEEIAARIVEITEGAIFVAHNVTFDYTVLRSEFRYLGYDFKRKKLCTVKLAKNLMPGKFSYSLGRLCSTLGIPLIDRHRAEGDTDATVILFQRLMALDADGTEFDRYLNARRTELAPNIPRESIAILPQVPGVYYFKDGKGKIIYVGKALRIKDRVLNHFYNAKGKEYELCQETASVDFVESGSELVAFLHEADEIQNHYPKFNTAQKKLRAPYCIVHYTNRKGIVQFGLDRKSATDLGTVTYWRREEAVARLEQICEKYNLCPRFTGLQRTKGSCSHYKITECNGICDGREDVSAYNRRTAMAIEEIGRNSLNFAIMEKGRREGEYSFVLVKDGLYRGYGFFGRDESVRTLEDVENFVILKKNTYHTTRIIASYLNANPSTVKIVFPEATADAPVN